MSENIVLQSIKSIPFFYDISEEDILLFLEFFRIRELDAGRYVFKQGDKPDGLYFVIEGKVKVVKKNEEGDEILLEKHEHPGIFGEMAIIDGSRRSASVVTLENFKGLLLGVDDFKKIIEANPLIAINFIRKIAHTLSLKLRIESDDRIGLV
jgi:CRP/FNR family transcriptional regulator/CRP/FNR family cyclic AMP-dependent transcriptional regulator